MYETLSNNTPYDGVIPLTTILGIEEWNMLKVKHLDQDQGHGEWKMEPN